MCGRYRRRSDKQRIAEAFQVGAGLDESIFEPGDDFAPQSLQPVIYWNEDGERQIEMMRWAFKLENRSKLLFNARSEGIERAPFWRDAFLKGRCIVPADAIYEWQEVEKGRKKPKYEFTIPARSRLEWQVSGKSGKISARIDGKRHLRCSRVSQMRS